MGQDDEIGENNIKDKEKDNETSADFVDNASQQKSSEKQQVKE